MEDKIEKYIEQMEENIDDQIRRKMVEAIGREDRQTIESYKDKFTKEFMEYVLDNTESFGKMFVVRFDYTEPSSEISDGNEPTVYRTMGMKMVEKYLDILELIKRIPYYQTPEYFQMFIDSKPTKSDIFELTRTVYSFNTWYEINKGNK